MEAFSVQSVVPMERASAWNTSAGKAQPTINQGDTLEQPVNECVLTVVVSLVSSFVAVTNFTIQCV